MPQLQQIKEEIARAEARVDTGASAEAIQAGNYRKGHVTIQGLDITIETPAGATRSGVDAKGNPWSVTLKNAYGYIKRTESAADGDHIDVFIGPRPDSELVFVVDQNAGSSDKFDEHKCVIGCLTAEQAKRLYFQNYSKGWKGFRSITALTMPQFKSWLADGDSSKPLMGASMEFHKTAAEFVPSEELLKWAAEETGNAPALDLVHYSRDKHPELRPLSYDELEADRTSGRWEKQPDKAREYVEHRREFESDLHRRLDRQGKGHGRDNSFLYATIADHESFGEPGTFKHVARLDPEIIDSSFFGVVGDNRNRVVIGRRGLAEALRRWRQAQAEGKLETGEFMGMDIRPRIEVIIPRSVSPLKIEKVAASKFCVPENYDSVYNLPGGVVILAGANDWESGWTWAGAGAKGSKANRPAVWIEIDHTECPGCHGEVGDGSAHTGKACADFAKAVVADWKSHVSKDAIQDLTTALEKNRVKHVTNWGMNVGPDCVAVDLDGTLAHHEPGGKFDPAHVGKPVPAMLRRVRDWLANGTKVFILTARAADSQNVPVVRRWLARHRIHACEVTNQKTPEMQEIWDDRAVAVERNTGKPLHKVAAEAPPRTGPEALLHALQSLDLTRLESEARSLLKGGSVQKRDKAVKILTVLEGLKRNNIKPEQLMVRSVPVIPPAFRPFSTLGDTFIPGNANEGYRDLIAIRDAHKEGRNLFGYHGSGNTRVDLYDTMRALQGFGDPVNPKTRARNVQGFLRELSGSSPKFSVFQRRLFSKPLDSVSRGVIVVDPELDIDQVGVPEDMAWTMYGSHVMGSLVKSGMPEPEALRAVLQRNQHARHALDREMKNRPVIYSRAPAWHKFNIIAGYPKITEGDAIKINPLVTTGLNADFDGDQMNLHVPALDDSVAEAKERLLPSKMPFSIKSRNRVMPELKQELVLGIHTAQNRQAKNVFNFPSKQAALDAIGRGEVSFTDEIEFPD